MKKCKKLILLVCFLLAGKLVVAQSCATKILVKGEWVLLDSVQWAPGKLTLFTKAGVLSITPLYKNSTYKIDKGFAFLPLYGGGELKMSACLAELLRYPG
jgi:hypothetical protein